MYSDCFQIIRLTTPGTTSFKQGDDAAFNFIVDSGYKVNRVIVDGQEITPSNGYTFPDIAADHTLHIDFAKLPNYKITVTKEGERTVSLGTSEFVEQSDAKFTFSPADKWVIKDDGFTSEVEVITENLDPDKLITVKASWDL